MKELDDIKRNKMISEIIEKELKMTLAVNAGHKPADDDQFAEDRKKLKRLRKKLGF